LTDALYVLYIWFSGWLVNGLGYF